jgi:hypothetical protein
LIRVILGGIKWHAKAEEMTPNHGVNNPCARNLRLHPDRLLSIKVMFRSLAGVPKWVLISWSMSTPRVRGFGLAESANMVVAAGSSGEMIESLAI